MWLQPSYVCNSMLQGIKASEEGGDSQSAGKHFPRMQPVDDKIDTYFTGEIN